MRARLGESVLAILYYGACFRGRADIDGLLDLYVLVDDYHQAYRRLTPALANALLPPNVFYLQLSAPVAPLRLKYAVISARDFVRHVSPRCFQASLWARFAQPCAAVYLRDTAARVAVVDALTTAVLTFLTRAQAIVPAPADALLLWRTGLAASYATELRPEDPALAAARIVDAAPERYRHFTTAAALPPPDRRTRRRARLTWPLRRVHGKLLNLLRLVKAVFTFEGGVDYVLWKIERHSGVRVEATDAMRRHPLLHIWATAWRLYRMGAFR
ncbi:MAG: hypothetical protein IT495_01780 [Gammaproteobacteria bacterium]|nr:hypothetical protein [Gammaproteobacteria bacterium]